MSTTPTPRSELSRTRTAPRQARSAKSLDLILDAAEQVFHEQGVAETSTVDVATAAGVSVGRLYYWYPDKDAVAHAVTQRAQNRLGAFVTELLAEDPTVPTADLVDRIVPGLAAFFVTHPGSLAVLARRPVGEHDPGESLCEYFELLAAGLVESRVPGIASAERDLVASVIVRIVIAMLSDYVRADSTHRQVVLQELRYLIAAYLHARYPSAGDPVWNDANYPVRPSAHRSRARYGDPASIVYPAFAERDADATG